MSVDSLSRGIVEMKDLSRLLVYKFVGYVSPSLRKSEDHLVVSQGIKIIVEETNGVGVHTYKLRLRDKILLRKNFRHLTKDKTTYLGLTTLLCLRSP